MQQRIRLCIPVAIVGDEVATVTARTIVVVETETTGATAGLGNAGISTEVRDDRGGIST